MFPVRGEGTSRTVKSEVTPGFSPPPSPPAQIPTRQRHLHFLFRSTRRVLLLHYLYRVVISCKLRIASSVYAPTLAPTRLSTTLLELTDLYAHLATDSNLAQFFPTTSSSLMASTTIAAFPPTSSNPYPRPTSSSQHSHHRTLSFASNQSNHDTVTGQVLPASSAPAPSPSPFNQSSQISFSMSQGSQGTGLMMQPGAYRQFADQNAPNMSIPAPQIYSVCGNFRMCE